MNMMTDITPRADAKDQFKIIELQRHVTGLIDLLEGNFGVKVKAFEKKAITRNELHYTQLRFTVSSAFIQRKPSSFDVRHVFDMLAGIFLDLDAVIKLVPEKTRPDYQEKIDALREFYRLNGYTETHQEHDIPARPNVAGKYWRRKPMFVYAPIVTPQVKHVARTRS